MKDPSRFELIASGVHKWILSVAIVIGAAWTLFVYQDVPRREFLKAQSNLVVRIEAHQMRVPGDSSLFVEGVITVKNVGTRNTRLLLNSRGQVEVTRLNFLGDSLSFGKPDTASIFMWSGQSPASKTSLQGGADYLPFVQRVDQPGLYLVSFSAQRDQWDVDRAGGHGKGNRMLTWSGATYVTVEAFDAAAN